jgi:hypothetical protein
MHSWKLNLRVDNINILLTQEGRSVAAGYLKRILRGIEVFFTEVARCVSDRAAEFKGGIVIVNVEPAQ